MRHCATGEKPDRHEWRAAPSAITLFYNVPVTIGVKPALTEHGRPESRFFATLTTARFASIERMERHSTAPVGRTQATFSPVNMNRLAKFLPLENVVIGLSVTSKKRVFEQAGLIFENQNGIARSTVTDNLFARERLGSTGLGEGVAIPHGRIKGLKQPLAAFVRLAEPIPFESPDGQPVSLLIFLLVPEQATQQHLEILSEIAQLLSDREARERLHTEEDRESLHRLLTQWQP
jgi:PTS system nitrogen regulatory IIA component